MNVSIKILEEIKCFCALEKQDVKKKLPVIQCFYGDILI
jgi:hypothetical protein